MPRLPNPSEILSDQERLLPLAAITVRIGVLVTVLLSLILPTNPGWLLASQWFFWPLVALVLTAYLGAGGWYWRGGTPPYLEMILTSVDVLAVMVLLIFTGGTASPYIPLYFLVLIGTTVFSSLRQTAVVTAGGFVLLALTAVMRTGRFTLPVVFEGSSTGQWSIETWTLMLGLVLCACLALPANFHLQRRLAEYRLIIRDRDERLKAANRELTQSFYDLESLTDRVRADHEAERETRQKLVVAQRFAKLGQLAAGAIYDMTNPITAIINESEFCLIKQEERPDKLRESMQRILTNANRLSKLTENLRLFARQGTEMIYGAIDLHLVVNRCVNTLDPVRRQRSAVCNLHLVDKSPKVLGVETQMEQVLCNLLFNAYQALPQPGGHVTIRTAIAANRVLVEVEDDGAGIAPDVAEHIFEPFFTTRSDGGAIGLGLHTARTIVEEHNGKISVRSQLGVGTVFVIDLPLAPTATGGT